MLIHPDPRRVIARLFLPGQEGLIEGTSRAANVVQRCLAMSETEASAVVERVRTGFAPRHRGLERLLAENFDAVAHRVARGSDRSAARRHLIGAYFTQEYAFEAAALFNPALVAHPDQTGVGAGQLRFVMSARAVGEGHVSSVVFRTGVFGPEERIALDDTSRLATTGAHRPGLLDREQVRHVVEEGRADANGESLRFVLGLLPVRFTVDALETALDALHQQRLTRVDADETAAHLRRAAADSYELEFPAETDLSERVIWPAAPVESHGIEDARFVRFTADDGAVDYRATYTAYDGAHVTPRLLHTADFRVFHTAAFTGTAATDKGMALFPRLVDGRHMALSRWDRESNAITTSLDGHAWDEPRTLQVPQRPWELIQLGNCGSPIETAAGWLVLTHGVGPMRTYAIGAVLLDLEDPSRVIAALPDPLLTPAEDERDGYVPNVVYSCGGLAHGDALVLPYGCSDSSIRVAVVDLPGLLNRLHPESDRAL